MFNQSNMTHTNRTNCAICGYGPLIASIQSRDHAYCMANDDFWYGVCPDCGSLTLLNVPSNMSHFYPSNYGNPRQSRRVVMQLLKSTKHRLLFKGLRKYNPDIRSILDYGCGDAHLLRDAVSCGLEAFGTDFDTHRKCNVTAVGATWIELNDVEKNEQIFDAILLLQVLEHLEDPDQLIAKLSNLLAPGGVLIIETPCPNGPDTSMFGLSLWGGLHAPRHYFIASHIGLADYLEKFNLENLEHFYIPSPYTWAETLRARFSSGRAARVTNRLFAIDNPIFLTMISLFEYTRLFFGGETSNQRVVLRKTAVQDS